MYTSLASPPPQWQERSFVRFSATGTSPSLQIYQTKFCQIYLAKSHWNWQPNVSELAFQTKNEWNKLKLIPNLGEENTMVVTTQNKQNKKQAGAELGQAQIKLEVIVHIVVTVWDEVVGWSGSFCHTFSVWWVCDWFKWEYNHHLPRKLKSKLKMSLTIECKKYQAN